MINLFESPRRAPSGLSAPVDAVVVVAELSRKTIARGVALARITPKSEVTIWHCRTALAATLRKRGDVHASIVPRLSKKVMALRGYSSRCLRKNANAFFEARIGFCRRVVIHKETLEFERPTFQMARPATCDFI